MAIVRATNGLVTLQELRPDDWQNFWPDQPQARASITQAATETVAHQSV